VLNDQDSFYLLCDVLEICVGYLLERSEIRREEQAISCHGALHVVKGQEVAFGYMRWSDKNQRASVE